MIVMLLLWSQVSNDLDRVSTASSALLLNSTLLTGEVINTSIRLSDHPSYRGQCR